MDRDMTKIIEDLNSRGNLLEIYPQFSFRYQEYLIELMVKDESHFTASDTVAIWFYYYDNETDTYHRRVEKVSIPCFLTEWYDIIRRTYLDFLEFLKNQHEEIEI
jgi:hypothetical protein